MISLSRTLFSARLDINYLGVWFSFRSNVCGVFTDCLLAKRDLLAIPGIDSERVDRYGDRILALVRNARKRLDEMSMGQQSRDETVPDPNHETVVLISSDNEDSDYVAPSSEMGSPRPELSRFFRPDAEVLAFRQTGK